MPSGIQAGEGWKPGEGTPELAPGPYRSHGPSDHESRLRPPACTPPAARSSGYLPAHGFKRHSWCGSGLPFLICTVHVSRGLTFN